MPIRLVFREARIRAGPAGRSPAPNQDRARCTGLPRQRTRWLVSRHRVRVLHAGRGHRSKSAEGVAAAQDVGTSAARVVLAPSIQELTVRLRLAGAAGRPTLYSTQERT